MRPMIIHTSHEQRKRITSQQVSDLQRVAAADASPFKRHFSCSRLDEIKMAEGVKAKGKMHPLYRRWSSIEKRSTSRSRIDLKADLQPSNFIWISVIVATVIVTVIVGSLVCRCYFLS